MERLENIKKGLECFAQDRSYMLPCSDCDYHGQGKPHCRKAVHEDAIAMIQHLEEQTDHWSLQFAKQSREFAEYKADVLQQLLQQLKAHLPKWISVEERLPEDGVDVIVHTDYCGGDVKPAYYRHNRKAWFTHNGVLLIPNVLHWMPLPEPPKEDEE